MMTLRQFAARPKTIHTAASWYLADLGEARGRYELHVRQSPQKLKVLREHAMIQSAVSSNRIEGVEVDASRVGTVVLGERALRDRNEQELRAYRDALKLIHESSQKLAVSPETLLRLHRISRGDVWDAGRLKEKDIDIIETYSDGRSRVRFRTVPAKRASAAVDELMQRWNDGLDERWVHPLILLAAFNLDLLCIHPFRDGNGRVSRLMLLLQCYHAGHEVGRYVSLERLIEENKERYYETLEASSRGWHEGKHDPWPYVNFLLFILVNAYREFEARVGATVAPRGAKTELVTAAIARRDGPFRVADLQRDCPDVSIDLIRRILKQMQARRDVRCLGRGRDAKWLRDGK